MVRKAPPNASSSQRTQQHQKSIFLLNILILFDSITKFLNNILFGVHMKKTIEQVLDEAKSGLFNTSNQSIEVLDTMSKEQLVFFLIETIKHNNAQLADKTIDKLIEKDITYHEYLGYLEQFGQMNARHLELEVASKIVDDEQAAKLILGLYKIGGPYSSFNNWLSLATKSERTKLVYLVAEKYDFFKEEFPFHKSKMTKELIRFTSIQQDLTKKSIENGSLAIKKLVRIRKISSRDNRKMIIALRRSIKKKDLLLSELLIYRLCLSRNHHTNREEQLKYIPDAIFHNVKGFFLLKPKLFQIIIRPLWDKNYYDRFRNQTVFEKMLSKVLENPLSNREQIQFDHNQEVFNQAVCRFYQTELTPIEKGVFNKNINQLYRLYDKNVRCSSEVKLLSIIICGVKKKDKDVREILEAADWEFLITGDHDIFTNILNTALKVNLFGNKQIVEEISRDIRTISQEIRHYGTHTQSNILANIRLLCEEEFIKFFENKLNEVTELIQQYEPKTKSAARNIMVNMTNPDVEASLYNEPQVEDLHNLIIELRNRVSENDFDSLGLVVGQILKIDNIPNKREVLNETLVGVIKCAPKNDSTTALELIAQLQEKGADINTIDGGYNLVGIAILQKNHRLARALVDRGVNLLNGANVYTLAGSKELPKLARRIERKCPELAISSEPSPEEIANQPPQGNHASKVTQQRATVSKEPAKQ